MNTATTVAELVDRVATVVYQARLGHLAVTGTLTDWRTHRHGTATAMLVTGNPPTARLALFAKRDTAAAIADQLSADGRDLDQPAPATAWGQLQIDRRWGLRLVLTRISLQPVTPAGAGDGPNPLNGGNHATRWPEQLGTIGLIDPEHGDGARGDVLAALADCDLTVIEHRVPVTGPTAPLRISRALDQLDRAQPDVTVVVRGGGADIDLDVFNHPAVIAAIDRHTRPVITGIGHATNTTHADHAAHTTCITPTAAATHVRRHCELPQGNPPRG